MGIDTPTLAELMSFTPVGQYADSVYPDTASISFTDSNQYRGGALHLSSLLPALAYAIGSPISTAIHTDGSLLCKQLGFPQARAAIVVLIDGLGYWNLVLRIGHAPYMRSLLHNSVNQRPIATCTPSTTVAALGVFGTGTCPGLTGMTGYTQRNPQTGALSQLIQFTNALAPDDLQRQPTVFERLADQGVRITSCGLPKFANSALTQAALRGTQYYANSSISARIAMACQASHDVGITYCYLHDVDKVGHRQGWDCEQWVAALERVDAQLAQLRRDAPSGTLIVITADHGMIASSSDERIDIAQYPALCEGVTLVGGEPRALMLYADSHTSSDEIAARWRVFLGDRGLVLLKRDVIERNILGLVDERIIPMIGDVFVFARGAVTLVDTRIQSDAATRLPGVHGSQTRLESDIPCLIDLV